MKSSLRIIITAILLTFGGTIAQAIPLLSTKPWIGFSTLFVDGFSYEPIVALSNCSASYIKPKQIPDTALALVLTNGHCTGSGIFGGGMPQPGEFFYKKQASMRANLLFKDGSTRASLRVQQILYATMTGTDLALLQLNQTYQQIKNSTGVSPFELTDVPATAGAAIDIPSGYWKRTYSCAIEAVIPTLKEAGWTMMNSVRYSPTGCEVIGGTSGSPIVNSATGVVVAINNTGNEDGQQCTMNNPCEVDAAGKITVLQGRGYGQQVELINSCIDKSGNFDLSISGCRLFH